LIRYETLIIQHWISFINIYNHIHDSICGFLTLTISKYCLRPIQNTQNKSAEVDADTQNKSEYAYNKCEVNCDYMVNDIFME
jgi:hypothetical protein